MPAEGAGGKAVGVAARPGERLAKPGLQRVRRCHGPGPAGQGDWRLCHTDVSSHLRTPRTMGVAGLEPTTSSL